MKPMQRPNPKNFGAVETIPGTSYPKPKHVVPNESTENHGITFSIEPKGNAAEGDAELEVLKCILCREGYLKRLMSSAKTVGKKFKPEVADILDLVRAASVDLVEAIVRWREIKGDHDSAYMWNGVNYLIKMPSDLDFLSDYLAIKKWMGFRLERNPFCIPFPMEDGAQMFSDRILDPQHIDDSSFSGLNHDFVIGGMNLMTMSRKYIYTPQDTGMLASPTKRKTLMSKSMDDFKSPYAVPQRVPTMFVPSVDANKSLAFEDSSMAKNARKLAKLHLKDTNAASVVEPSVLTETTTFQSPDKFSATASSTRDSGALIPVANSLAATSSGKNSSGALMRQQVEESFILNNDMKKIRQCELVLLKEEEKFGRHKRDPEGRIIPALQADTLILAKELALDNRRPIGEKARTSAKIATHAAASDVGVEEERWMPDAESAAKLAAAQSKMLEKSDEDAVPRERGKQKIGGHLNPIKAKGAHSKSRIPLIPNLAGEMEFNRARRKQTLGDRLNEIAQLRDKIQQERQALEDSVAAAAEAERRKQRKMVKKPTKSEMLLSRLAGGSSSLSKKPDESHMLHSMSMTSLGSSEGQTGVVLSQTLPNPLVSMDDATAEKNTSEPDADSGVRNTFSADSTMRDHNLSKALADISIVEGKESSIDSGGIEGSFGTGSQESGSAPTTPSQDLQRKKYEEVQNRITEKLQELDAQGTEYATELEHITKIDKKINKIKVVERKANNMEKSREIERKRRNLTEKEAVRKGPPPDELANQYDYYSTRIQKMIRGFVGRRFVARYRIRLGNAVAKIQAGLRGLFSRNRVRRLRREFYCATYIQKNFRGWKARGVSASIAKGANLAKSAKLLQRVWRGVLGKKRARSKKRLDIAAEIAMQAVDPNVLFASDVKELAKKIQLAIVEPASHTFPPDEVLHLIRLSVMVLQSAKGLLGVTDYSDMNLRFYNEVDGRGLTWQQASMMTMRSERFIRLLRGVAFGSSTRPPRLIQIPSDCNLIFAAQSMNPAWCENTFLTMGAGSKICIQLFRWLNSIIEVAQRQAEFANFITSSFPDWLPKLQGYQRQARQVEMEIIIDDKAHSYLGDVLENNSADPVYVAELQREMSKLKRITNENRIKHRSLVKQQSDLTLSQASREEFSLLQLSIKVGNVEESVAAATVEYTDLLIAAENKDPAAEVKLPTARMALNHLKLKCAELSSSYKVMQAQCEANDQRRKDPGAMLPEVRVKATTAGEAKAFYIVAVLKKIVYMRSTGLRYLADYSPAQTKIYEALEKEEQNRKKEARAAFVLVDGMRKEHDAQIVRLVEEDDLKQRKNKDFFVPSESELQEERLEDEKMAIEERKKRRQFLSDKVLFDAPKRPRPVIVAFARDVPHYSKLRIHKEVTARLPGLFTVLDIEKNMGIHMHSIQTVLDAGKSVIMSVDHGLTKLTRTNFLKNLEMTLRGLIPVPYVVLIVGDETNKRLPGGSESFGVVNTDLDCMRDKDIKIALETMVYALDQLTVHSDYMSAISEEIMPPSPSYIVVIEAIYVIHSNVRTVRKPDDNMTAVSWRSLRLLLANPEEFVSHMRGIKRGSADIFMVELIDAYKKHKLWPPVTGQERKVDPVLHSLAFFVEHWAISERETINKNGIPSQLLYKSSVKGIHTVVTVTDGVDPEDNVLSESGGGGWRVPAAQVIRGALRDLRVSKNVQKIDNVLYNLSVYREDSMIYFDAYDPATSLVFLESVQVSDVPNLLRPNGHGIAKGVDVHPPVTPREMYVRLCKLLRFEKVSKYKNARQRLLCRREYTFMKNANCKIDGFRTFLTCFEGALGELYFSAYIPEYSATLTCLVDEHVRARLLINADPEFEKKTAEVEDATGALPYVMDRLRIAPSKTMYQVREISNSLDEQHDPRVATGMDRTMGLALRCRCVGGAGKLLLRRVVLFCKVPHILVLKSSSFTKTLLIYLYEPRTSYHMKIRLCPFFREMLFGSLTDDVNVFYKKLNKRLVFSWRGKHSITFDTTIYRSVRKIQKRLLVLTIALVDEQSVLMSLMDNGISTNFFTNVSKEQLIKILHFTPTVEAIKKTFKAGKVVESDAHVGGILSEVKSSSTFKDSSGVISGDSNSGVEAQTASLHFIEPKLFDVSLQTILSDPANLQTIGKKIEHIVRPMDPNSRLAGYMADEPTNLVFLSLSPSLEGDGKEPELLLDTTLRHSDWLKHGPRVNSVEGVVASRRQVPVVIMEEALNELAQAKADAAAKVAAENARVAAELFVTTKEIEPEEMVEAVQHASNLISDTIVETLEIKEINREAERRHPGLTQDMRHAMLYGPDGRTEHKIPIEEFTEVQRDILVAGEKLIFERGCRTNYREGKARWHGHVSVKVYEGVCWMGEDGVGKTYRFIVYESNVGKYFEGFVRSTRHLREILGIHAQDLLEKKKATEMLMFVIKYRMDLVKNNVNWDGTELEELDDDAPEYRVEFQMDRLYSEDKITPINAAGNADNDANAAKLIDMDHARGKKLLRLARRVSGLLMQLTVFEIATPDHLKPAETLAEKQTRLAKDTKVAIPREKNDSDLNEKGADVEIGYAEFRTSKSRLEYREAPTLRILGYDPRSKRKCVFIAVPQAVKEVAGGGYSPYLDAQRRRELARIVCEALLLYFPRGKPFELSLPWSGATQEVTNAMAGGEKNSWRSSADRINKRPGKIFRSALRINSLELVVTMYSQTSKKAVAPTEDAGPPGVSIGDAEGAENADGAVPGTKYVELKQIIANFYSVAASEAYELLITEEEQIARVKRPIMSFEDGAIRAAAIRRLCRFFEAKLVEDPTDDKKKILDCKLLGPGRDFVTEYQMIKPNQNPGEDVRPVGVPSVFLPLDTCGVQLFRQGISRQVDPVEASSLESRRKKNKNAEKDFIITIYTKSESEGPERGLVVKIYEKESSCTVILHIGPSELIRLTEQEGEYELLRNMVRARETSEDYILDEIETKFTALTEKGDELNKVNKFQQVLFSIIIREIGIRMDAENKLTAYMKSAPRGIPPV